MSSHEMRVCAQSYCILLGHVLWISLEACFFSGGGAGAETGGIDLWERRVGGGTERRGGRGNDSQVVIERRRIKVKRKEKIGM